MMMTIRSLKLGAIILPIAASLILGEASGVLGGVLRPFPGSQDRFQSEMPQEPKVPPGEPTECPPGFYDEFRKKISTLSIPALQNLRKEFNTLLQDALTRRDVDRSRYFSTLIEYIDREIASR